MRSLFCLKIFFLCSLFLLLTHSATAATTIQSFEVSTYTGSFKILSALNLKSEPILLPIQFDTKAPSANLMPIRSVVSNLFNRKTTPLQTLLSPLGTAHSQKIASLTQSMLPNPLTSVLSYKVVSNTSNVSYSWTPSSANTSILYQELIQILPNAKTQLIQRLAPTQNAVIFKSNGGRYVIRQVDAHGTFIDSDGASSIREGDPAKQTRVVVDEFPPILSSVNVTWTKDPTNPLWSTQTLAFKALENIQAFYEVKDLSTPTPSVFYTSAEWLPTGDAVIKWDAKNKEGLRRDGSYAYTLFLQDMAGNNSKPVTGSVVFDSFPPNIYLKPHLSIFSPNSKSQLSSAIFNLESNEPVSASMTILSSDNNPLQKLETHKLSTQNYFVLDSKNCLSIQDGTYTLLFNAFDKAHLNSQTTSSITIDRGPPQLIAPAVVRLQTFSQNLAIPIKSNEFGLLSVAYALKTSTQNMGQGTSILELPKNGFQEGHTALELSLTDQAGNTSTCSVSVIADNTAPALVYTVPKSFNVRRPAFINLQATDNLSTTLSVELSVKTSSQVHSFLATSNSRINVDLSTALAPLNLSNGTYTLLMAVSDEAGNLKVTSTNLTIAATAPLIQAHSFGPISFQKTTLLYPFSVTHTGFTTLQQLHLDLVDQNNKHTSILRKKEVPLGEQTILLDPSLANLPDGDYTLQIRAISETGLDSTFNVHAILDSTPPTFNTVTLMHNPINFKQSPFQIKATVSDKTQQFGQATLFYLGKPISSQSVRGNEAVVTFNGLIDHKPLSDGRYMFDLAVSDKAGNTSTQSVQVTVDKTPPVLSKAEFDLPVFSPNGDGEKDITQITIQSSEPVTAKLVWMKNQKTIKTVSITKPFTDTSLSWDGYSDLRDVSDGTYTINIVLTDLAGNTTTINQAAQVAIQQAVPAITNVAFSQEKLSPTKPFTITFDVPSTGSVSANIQNNQGDILAQLAVNKAVSQESGGVLSWDGKDNQGKRVRDGEYILIINFTDSLGIPVKFPIKKIIEVDQTSPYVTWIQKPPLFLDKHSKQAIPMQFKSSEPVLFWLEYTVNNHLYKTPSQNEEKGHHTIQYPFNNLSESILNYELVVSDLSGNQSRIPLTTTLLQTGPLSLKSDQPYYLFSPNGDSINEELNALISSTTNGPSTLNVTLKSNSGKTLKSSLFSLPLSSIKFDWDGKDSQSIPQPDGSYTLTLQLIDALGNPLSKDIPVYVIREKTKLLYTDNQKNLSFNKDGVNDLLSFSCDILIPNTALSIDEYKPLNTLKRLITQNGKTIKEDYLKAVKDRYSGSFDGTGLLEGPFQIQLSGESEGRIVIETVTANYLNDLTPPKAASIAYVSETKGITSFSDTQLRPLETSHYTVNQPQASVFLETQGADSIEVFTAGKTPLKTESVSGSKISSPLSSFDDTGNYPGLAIINNLNCQNEGPNTFYFVTVDKAGNRGPTQSVTIIYDHTAPTLMDASVLLNGSPLSYLKQGSYTFNLVFSEALDPAHLPILEWVNGRTRIPLTFTVSSANRLQGTFEISSSQANGSYSLVISGLTDIAQNQTTIQLPQWVTVDTVSPSTPRFVNATALSNTPLFTPSIEAEIDTAIDILSNNTLLSQFTQHNPQEPIRILLPEGTHTLKIKSTDRAGNSSESPEFTTTIDITGLQVTGFTFDSSKPSKAGTYPFEVRFSEPVLEEKTPLVTFKTSTHRIPKTTLTEYKNTSLKGTVTFENGDDGQSTFDLKNVYDTAHNKLDHFVMPAFLVDSTPPAAPVLLGHAALSSQNPYIDTIQAEPGSTVQWTLDQGDTQSFVQTQSTRPFVLNVSEGIHTLTFKTIDPAGNTSTLSNYSILADRTPPSVSSLTVSQPFINLSNTPIQINASAVDNPNGSGVDHFEFEVSKDFPSNATILTKNSPTGTSTFSNTELTQEGLYYIKAYAVDKIGNRTLTPQIQSFTNDSINPILSSLTDSTNGTWQNASTQAHFSLNTNEINLSTIRYKVSDSLNPNAPLNSGSQTTSIFNFSTLVNTLGSGTYLCSFQVEDKAGNTSEWATKPLYYDTLAPDIVSVSQTSTTNRGTTSEFNATLQFSEAIQTSPLAISLKFKDGSTVQPSSLNWSDDKTQVLAHFSIKAIEEMPHLLVQNITDKANNIVNKDILLDYVDNTPPVINAFGANASTFSAIRNTGEATIIVTLNVTEDYQKLLVKIYDKNGALKKTLLDRSGAKGPVTLDTWNGKDEQDNYLPKGWYVMKAYAVDLYQNTGELAEGLFEITEQHLDIKNPISVPLPYSFKASGARSFTYSLAQRIDNPDIADKPNGLRAMSAPIYIAKVSESIYKKNTTGSDTLMATLCQDTPSTEFTSSALGIWNGKLNNDPNQVYVQSGQYYLLVKVKNMKDIFESELKIPFTVDHDSPQFSNINYTLTPISTLAEASTQFAVTAPFSDTISTQNISIKLTHSEKGFSQTLSSVTGQTQAQFTVSTQGWNLTDGNHPFTLTLIDEAQNTTTLSLPATFDSTPPQFNFTTPAYASQNVSVSLLPISDASSTQITYKLGANGTYQAHSSLSTTGYPETTTQVFVKITDLAGNSSEISKPVIIDKSISAPSFTLNPSTFTNQLSTQVTVQHSEPYPANLLIQTDSGTWQTLAYSPTFTWTLPSTDGPHSLRVKLKDQAGNLSGEVTQTITLDRVSPTITAPTTNLPNEINIINTPITISTSGADNSSGIQSYTFALKKSDGTLVKQSTQAAKSITYSASDCTQDGSYTVFVNSTDKAGNNSPVQQLTFTNDTTAPVLSSIQNSSNGAWQNNSTQAQLSITYTETNLYGFMFQVYNINNTSASGLLRQIEQPNPTIAVSTLLNGLPSAQYICYVKAIDKAGNLSTWHSTYLNYDTVPPSLSSYSLSSGYVNASQTSVVLFAAASDTQSGLDRLEYRIDSGNWTPFISGSTVSLSNYSEGNHFISVRALDKVGNISSVSGPMNVVIDRTAPTLPTVYLNYASGATAINTSVGSSVSGLTGSDSGSGLNSNGYEYKLNNGTWTSFIPNNGQFVIDNYTPNMVANGSNTLQFRLSDKAGNFSSIQTLSFTSDTGSPSLSINTSILHLNPQKLALTIPITTSDSLSGIQRIEYTLKPELGGPVYSGTATTTPIILPANTLSLADGKYHLSIAVYDNALNQNYQLTSNFIYLDSTPPVLNKISGATSIQQALNKPNNNVLGSSYIVLTTNRAYDALDPNPVIQRARIFNENNQLLMDFDSTKTSQAEAPVNANNNTTEFRWDGWVHVGNGTEAIQQAPEGVYFLEAELEDNAGNRTTLIHDFKLENEILVAGNSGAAAHTPGIVMNGSTAYITWGKGDRSSYTAICSAPAVDYWGWRDTYDRITFYAIDIPQLVTYAIEHYDTDWFKTYLLNPVTKVPVTTYLNDTLKNQSSNFYELFSPRDGCANCSNWQKVTFSYYPSGYFRHAINAATGQVVGETIPNSDTCRVTTYKTDHSLDAVVAKSVFNEFWTTDVYITPIFNSLNTSATLANNIYSYASTVLSDRRSGTLGYLHKSNSSLRHTFSTSSSLAGYTLVKTISLLGKSGAAQNLSYQNDPADSSICHVAWEDSRDGLSRIFYKKLYSSSPFNNSGAQFNIYTLKPKQNPELSLVSPKSDGVDVRVLHTTHPTFTWTIPTENMTPQTTFKIELWQTQATSNIQQLPTFNINSTPAWVKAQTITIPAGTFAQKQNTITFTPDVYNSLGKTPLNTVYRWQVKANFNGNDSWIPSTTSELFKIDPPLAIEALINYPNPFSTQTRIRYKLSKEAQSVSIRIFDIAGKLVRVLDNCPTEGTTSTHEYHDVLWDGKNGVGDTVLNGVYVYKVIAIDEHGTHVEARSKAAKLN